jgi:hypothetical protein
LSVAGDIVEGARQAVWRTHVEERLDGVDVNAATVRSDGRGHQLVVERVIEQFLLVRPPARIARVAKDGRTSRLDLRARSALPNFEDAVFRAFARWNPIPLPASYPAESVQLTVTFFFNETPP